ncbi:sister chromatid cohesion protein SCC4 [Aristolochia californica]|uniref:sister chromatid cohesion protein SCC4 n=1 Tax=Aristolochia californica TaxID=171875 RepID=UPI0035DBE0DF
MDSVLEGLWGLADLHEKKGEIGKSVKCLEAICQSNTSLLPIVEIKTRLRIAALLLKYTYNLSHAKFHLERSQLLLKSMPSCFELKCRAYSLLSQCYHIMGAIPVQKQVLNKALELTTSSGDGLTGKLWACNFNSQLANSLAVLGDYRSSVSALECGYACATEMCYPELQMYFATSVLHVYLMQWENVNVVEKAVERCDQIWNSIQPDQRQHCLGLFFYSELLQTFYRLKICDYKNAAPHVAQLKGLMEKVREAQNLNAELDAINERISESNPHHKERLQLYEKQKEILEQLKLLPVWGDRLELAPSPLDGEWLPKNGLFVLIDLIIVMFDRPKGLFKESGRRIQSGLQVILEELGKLKITDGVTEKDLYRSSICMAGLYLMLLMHFLENKVALELTRSEYVEAQEALVQMKNWFMRFPTLLPGCDSIIEMLRGQYAHSLGCFSEAAFHFIEATKGIDSKSMQTMCNIYAALSLICIGDVESSSQALDLIGPIYRVIDSFVGVREKTGVIFSYGLLLMKQHNFQEARTRLAYGLRVTHQVLGNIQLVSQYLTVLGSLALALHDNAQAREILKSSLTLAKTLHDIPTQIWVLSVLTGLYQELGEKGNGIENSEYEKKKEDDLQKRLSDARSSIHHHELIEKVRVLAHRPNELDIKRAIAGPSTRADLDIPESVGLFTPPPAPFLSRLSDFDSSRLGKRKV